MWHSELKQDVVCPAPCHHHPHDGSHGHADDSLHVNQFSIRDIHNTSIHSTFCHQPASTTSQTQEEDIQKNSEFRIQQIKCEWYHRVCVKWLGFWISKRQNFKVEIICFICHNYQDIWNYWLVSTLKDKRFHAIR